MVDPTPDEMLDAAMTRAESEAAVTPPAEEPAHVDPPSPDPAAGPPAGGDPPADPAADPAVDEPVEDPALAKLADAVAAALAKIAPPAPKPAADPAPPAVAPEVKPPAHLAELIDSEDEREQRLGKALFEDWKEQRRENEELRQRLDQRDDGDLEMQLATELAEALPNYSLGIDDKGVAIPLDPNDVDERVAAFANDPKTSALAAQLAEHGGMDAVVRHLYPEAVKKAKPSAPPKGASPGQDGPGKPARRVPGSPRLSPGALPRGGGGNAPPPVRKASTPPPNEDMSACIDRAFQELHLN